jgi:ATP-dependent Zn protease
MDKISSLTPGFTGADLENLVNLASVNASKNNKTAIDMGDMDYAFDRVVIGLENRSLNRILTDNEKMKTAIHVRL